MELSVVCSKLITTDASTCALCERLWSWIALEPTRREPIQAGGVEDQKQAISLIPSGTASLA
jgi:hypothetical protein